MPEPDEVFAALGDPVRVAVVRALLEGPERSSALAERLGLARPKMSKHLRVLLDAGLVEVQVDPEDHRAREYHLRRAGFAHAQDFLAEVEAFWQDQLAAFKHFAEQQ
ncbi:MAG: winged helix-turn-helix transcriptional regulator [Alphaproteobacteria bacterium]|nr:winged helix-turn-helix transcriptional regulator [Alphaproteobacteria bacterium]